MPVKNKGEIKPRIALAASWEIRHKEKPYSIFFSGSYSRICLIESALFHNTVWSAQEEKYTLNWSELQCGYFVVFPSVCLESLLNLAEVALQLFCLRLPVSFRNITKLHTYVVCVVGTKATMCYLQAYKSYFAIHKCHSHFCISVLSILAFTPHFTFSSIHSYKQKKKGFFCLAPWAVTYVRLYVEWIKERAARILRHTGLVPEVFWILL